MSSTLLIGFTGAALLVLWTMKRRLQPAPLPPGPRRAPLIGNLLQMPHDKAPLVFHEWAGTYGDVMYLKLPGMSIVVLDSLQAAEDLLEKRSAIYSDRPIFPLYELFGWTSTLTMMPYGKKFTQYRQMHHAYLNRQRCLDYHPIQLDEARTLVKNLWLAAPDEKQRALGRFATGIVTQLVSGHRIESDDDIYLRMTDMVAESLTRAEQAPGATAIDFFPFLKYFPSWFPGTYYANMAREWYPTVRELHTFPVEEVKKQRKEGIARPSFVLEQLEAVESMTEEYEEDLRGNAAVMFAAGESTTWGTISVFLLAMVLYPECQRKAQEEINAIIGNTRLPEFHDRDSLPYVEALCREVYRWNPGVPLALPHRCIQDDIYRGMLIPKGTIVFPNIKGMTLSPKIYSDPTDFIPERYLPRPLGRDEPYFTGHFGFGRRICTGQHLADNSVWIAIATILASCRITNAMDENDVKIVPPTTMTYGLMSHPVDFRCVVEPRTPEYKFLLEE
ncbi:cytochrome P450 [Roridomyces roridus]|uniref:Cytochrome P450 n=1 Tax=Roridomyces roridus TaxID=1738132 RepID=A0AAD7BID3_9AGAR|nr:cytochrome P450 [Roridomyces roridus]